MNKKIKDSQNRDDQIVNDAKQSWIKSHKLLLVCIVAIGLALIILASTMLNKKKNKQTSSQADTPKPAQQVTINNARLNDHQDFLNELESDKDLMIASLNQQIESLKIESNITEENFKNYRIAEAQINLSHGKTLEKILPEIIEIGDSLSDKELEIKRQRIARYFKDDLSKATYEAVESSTPSKITGKECAMVGVPIISKVYRSEDLESCELATILVASKDGNKYTAFYQVNWDGGMLVSLNFLGMTEGFNYK